jgi:hypothetical protein
MKYTSKNPNGINQIASSSVAISVLNTDVAVFTTSSFILGGALTSSNALITGNVVVLGTASINTLVVNQTKYSSGSNQLGDGIEDTQTLFGTVRIPTGSFTVTGSSIMTGSLNVTGGITGSLFGTASFANTASFVNPLTQSVSIRGTGTTSATTAFRVENANASTSLQIRDDGAVIGSNIIVNTLSSTGTHSKIIMQGATVTGSTSSQISGILFGPGITGSLSTGTQQDFLLGRNISVSSGGAGDRNFFVFGTGIAGNNLVGVHNHIIMGCNSNLPTFIITPASGTDTTGGASLGLSTNYNTSTWVVRGKVSGSDSDKVQQNITSFTTALNIRRNDGLANGTFWNRVTLGTLLEVNATRTFVISTSSNTVNVTRGVPLTASVLYDINILPPIATWVNQNNTFAGNINYYGNLVLGTTPDNDESSLFQLNNTTKGFLPPRTNLTSNISNPAQGLITYLTGSTNEGLYYYNSGSYQGWTKVLNSSGSQSISGDLIVTGSLLIGENSSSLYTSRTTIINSGSTDLYSIPTSSYDAVYFDYVIKSGSNARAGQVFSTYITTASTYIDNSTSDIGNTSVFYFSSSISSSNLVLHGSTTSDGWKVKTIIRGL